MKKEFRFFQRRLRANGYYLDRCTGSHYIYKRNDGDSISINKDPNAMVLRRLCKEHCLK